MVINRTSSFLLPSLLFVAFTFLTLETVNGGWEAERRKEAVENNPYYFNRSSFETILSSKVGVVRILPKFTERSRRLFRVIENPRFFTVEMAPKTFVMPHQSDAGAVYFVLRGHGIITLVTQKRKDIFHVKQGDVVKLVSGGIRYIYNTDVNRRLRIAILAFPANNPGAFANFFLPGLDGQDSYLNGFSSEVLTSSFKVSRELIDKVFRQQKGVSIIRPIPSSQINYLLWRRAASSGHEQSVLFNILNQQPVSSNEYGKFYEAAPEKFQQLKDFGVSVSLVNMSQGSIFVPHFSSKATMIVFVETGCARFEMAASNTTGVITWHVSDVCEGEMFVIPAAHPVALVSLVADAQNFVAIGFGINAQNNSRYFFTGPDNILKKLGKKTTRLAFGVEAKVAEKVFTSQNKSYFVRAVSIRRDSS